MSCSCSRPLALFLCCGLAGFAAGDAIAQGMTPLRVDPTLLGLPPVEKKAPQPPKPAESAVESGRAEVKPVEGGAVEQRPLVADGESAPAAPSKQSPAKPARAASPDQIPAQAVAPKAAPAAAEPSPAPLPQQSGSAVVAAPAPRPRDDERPAGAAVAAGAATTTAKVSPAAAPVQPAAAPTPSSTKVTTLAPLRVHPGLLGQPVLASGGGAPGAVVRAAPGTVAAPTSLAAMEKAGQEAWRAGQPPVLQFSTEVLELPEGSAGTPALRTARALEPLQSTSLPRPMFLTADDLSGITDHEAVATGNVEARKAGAVVNADRMTYWPVEDELEAIGNVRLAQADDTVTGPRMRMKMGEQTGVFDQPEFTLKREAKWAAKERERFEKDKGGKGSAVVGGSGGVAWQSLGARMSRPEPGSLMNVLGVSSEDPPEAPTTTSRGSAERLDFEGENKLRIINGSFTTCKPGDDGWYVKAEDLALNYDTEIAEGRNATVYFQNAPIFHSPWMSFSLNNARKSGFLTPTFGQSTESGLMLSTPYYWNIAPNMDATISPRYYSKRGAQLASEFRYLDYTYQGNLRAEYLPNDRQEDNKDRYAYSVRHQQNLGYGLGAAVNLSGVSDDKYFTDLSSRSVLSSQRQLLRQGIVSYGGGWWTANMIGQSYQTLNPDPDPTQQIEKPYTLGPQINLTARRPDFFGADFAMMSQYTSFTHDKKDEGRRMVAYPQLSLPFVQPGWYVTPKVGAHVTNYSLDRRTTTGPESISRSLPIASVDTGMTFERQTTWFGAEATQTLEPRLYYVYIPFKDQADIPVFDSALGDFNFAQIFSENQFIGQDRINNANQVTAALTTRLLDPSSGAEAMRAMFGQRYYLSRQKVALTGPSVPQGEDGKWNKSDFLAAFSGRVLPKTFLDAALQYNPSDTRMERSSVGVRYQPEFGKVLNASWRFASKESVGTSGQFKNVDIAGQWPIWGGWSAVGRYNYSILDHKPVETLGGLEYSAGCWAVRLVGHQVATVSGKTNTSFFVQLELNDFARIGSNPADLLRRNISGYGLSGQPVADPIFGE